MIFRTASLVMLVASAALCFVIWVLGVGVPGSQRNVMGLLFVALHVGGFLRELRPADLSKQPPTSG